MCSVAADSSAPLHSPALTRGFLITFEGPDGCGKSTVARGCQAFLQGRGYDPVALFREPGHSAAGHRIRQLSKAGRGHVSPQEEIDLFIEDRRWDLDTNINPVLAQRGVVLLDRYYHSSIAYQGARSGDPAMVRRLNEAFAPRPDLVALLQLPVDVCLDRIRSLRGGEPDLFEQRESLEQVIGLFDSMDDPEIVRFDAAQPQATLQGQVNSAVEEILARHHR